MKQLSVKISTKDGKAWYLLAGHTTITNENGEVESMDIHNIEEYSLTGGPLDPFEYAVIKISTKKLKECAKELSEEEGIVVGQNKVYIEYYGVCKHMTVAQFETNDEMLKITAYCDAKGLATTVLGGSVMGTPFNVIQEILTTSLVLDIPFKTGNDTESASFIYCYDDTYDSNIGEIEFPMGENVWFVLQICAISLGCILFFANDKAYLIDYRIPPLRSNNNLPITDVGAIFLHQGLTQVATSIAIRVLGIPEYTKSQVDSIVNHVEVSGKVTKFPNSGSEIEEDSIAVEDALSVEKVGVSSKRLNTRYLNYAQRAIFARNYLDYHLVASQGVSFTINEVSDTGEKVVWTPYYDTVARSRYISDTYSSKVMMNEDSTGRPMLQKIFLSRFTISYPKGVTEYTFGQMVNNDLPQAVSQLDTRLGL